MINQEIFWGLKSALERKQSLKLAMISLNNAGYDKKEIEEAEKEKYHCMRLSDLKMTIYYIELKEKLMKELEGLNEIAR